MNRFLITSTAVAVVALGCVAAAPASAAQLPTGTTHAATTASLDPRSPVTVDDLGADGVNVHTFRVHTQDVPGSTVVVVANGTTSMFPTRGTSTLVTVTDGLRTGVNTLVFSQRDGRGAGTPGQTVTYTYGTGTAPKPALDSTIAPKVMNTAINAVGRSATVFVKGQDVLGSTMQFTANGVTQSVPVQAGGAASATVRDLRAGENTITVVQLAGSARSKAATASVRLGDADPGDTTTPTRPGTEQPGGGQSGDDRGAATTRVTVTSSDSYVQGERKVLTGTATPNATLRVTIPGQRFEQQVTVEASGRWTATTPVLNGSGYDGNTVTQYVRGAFVGLVEFRLTAENRGGTTPPPASDVRPVTVTSSNTYVSGERKVLAGTATPKARIWVSMPGRPFETETTADASGKWTVETPFLGGTGTYSGNSVRQYVNGDYVGSVEFTLRAARA